MSEIITFADSAVENVCLANFDYNGDGYIMKAEAASVTSLGTAFKENTEITSFEELLYFTGVTSLASGTFANCTALTSVDLTNITNLGGDSLNGTSIERVILPNITSIDSYIMRYNTAVKLIDIGDKCTWIANRAFSDCSNVEAIICRATTPPTLGYSTSLATNSCPIYVPDESYDTYLATDIWKGYSSRLKKLSEYTE